MKVLVTGADGYIGGVLCPLLTREGYEVTGYDARYFEDDWKGSPRIKAEYVDIRWAEKKDLEGFDAVVHLAALSNDPMGALDPYLTLEINYLASVRLADLARQAGVKRFVFSSSCSVYGSTDELASESAPLNPLTAYAKSKVMAEKGIAELATKDFSPVFMRNATVYGYSPNLRTDLAVNNLTANAFLNKQVRLNSDGQAFRPFIHISDLCHAFQVMLEAPVSMIHNEIFNVGSNYENYKIKDIAEEVCTATGAPIVIAPDAQPDKRNYNVNFVKIRKYFDFTPLCHVPRGIAELLEAFNLNSFDTSDMITTTRLTALQKLLDKGELDSKLYWVSK